MMMMRLFRLALALYLAVILQTTLAPAVQILGVRPDFLFVLVVLVAFHEGPAGGALCGFVAGLFVDLNSSTALGITSLANSVLAFGIGSVADRLVRSSVGTRFFIALVAVALRDQIVFVLLPSVGAAEAFRLFFVSALPGGLYTAILAPLVMGLSERVIHWEPERTRGLR